MGRYDTQKKQRVTDWSGRTVNATTFSIRKTAQIRGEHLRRQGERLDHLAQIYFLDPTASWRLVEANEVVNSDQLSVKTSVTIPEST